MDDLEDKEEAGDPAEALMQRGELFRKLRRLEQDDEEQRRKQQELIDSSGNELDESQDQFDVLPDSKLRVLRYESYLTHQSYYDDLKHVDYDFVDFGYVVGMNPSSRLIIEQNKSLGKGGLCWDAAFILAEFLIEHQDQLLVKRENDNVSNVANLIELGSGTGLCGLMLAKGVPNNNVHVHLTDLPELQSLMTRNAKRNFDVIQQLVTKYIDDDDDRLVPLSKQDEQILWQGGHVNENNEEQQHGTVTLGVLRWGDVVDMANYPPADVVIGADVVASLYDPAALAKTIHALCRDSNSLVVTSYKERLSGPHEVFRQELGRLFEHVEHIVPKSRNKNPEVRIIRATGKQIAST